MLNSGTTPHTSPPGWYDSGDGRLRWFDGIQWTDHIQAPSPAPPQPPVYQHHMTGPMTAQSLNVRRDVSYVRQQKGHSILLHTLLIGWLCLWLNVVYISLSPNHYWHA